MEPLRLEQFHFYDRRAETRRTKRDLPHWEQPCVCAFVTFRALDSLPRDVLDQWLAERAAWLAEHGINAEDKEWRDALDSLTDEMVNAFHRTFSRRIHDLLDAGHGECLLRRPELRRIVTDSLMHWHNERCLLAGWVVMPNHLHVLVQPMAGESLLKICESWKLWTARRIFERLGRTGHFWQGEGWDHLLRQPVYLRKYRKYMRLNPVKARLTADEFSLWLPEIEGLEEG